MGALALPAAFVVVNGLLLLPGWILQGGAGTPWVAGEAVLLVAIFLLVPDRRWSGFLAGVAAFLILGLSFLLLADAAARTSLSRPMSLYLDWHLLGAVWNLMVGAVGLAPALLSLVATLTVFVGLGWALLRLLGESRTLEGVSTPRGVVAGGLVLVLALSVGVGESAFGRLGDAVRWPGATLVAEQVRKARDLLEERERFARQLRESPSSHAGVPGLLEGLGGRTVILAFVESYGLSTLDDPRYAPVIRPRLDELGRRMETAGLALATGSLVAPTQGGQSWFSHGSLLSGLWLDNQAKYDLLLTTDRETLVDDFDRAGYHTVALMPAITLAWPEGEWFGYDEIYAFDDIGYRGPPLNWVTMPDQFTWAFLEERIRTHDPTRPVFAEVGLISSHAPWTPILPVLADWSEIGDGSVFSPWRDAGERPEDLWRDMDRVRDQFALSVDYALHAMTAYAERFVGDDVLLIVMGDHQPAPLITGEGASWAVPVHVISGDPALVNPFVEWGFRAGPFPSEDPSPPGMDYFREWFVDAYSGPSPPAGEASPGGEGAPGGSDSGKGGVLGPSPSSVRAP